MTLLSRRSFLAGSLLALPAARALAAGAAEHPLAGEGWLATAGEDEGFAAVSISGDGTAHVRVASTARLHGLEASPKGPLAVAVGRRPGKVAIAFDRRHGGEVARFAPGEGRVFAGHGRFSPDGKAFLTTEIEHGAETNGARTMGRGIVARRDVAHGFAIIDEWPSAGDGPHDLMRSGDALVVANGGIEPHTPEALDAEVTGSTIALLDPETGAVRAEGRPSRDLASLSLRHLAVDGRGTTVVAAQDLLNDGVARPLLFRIGADGTPHPFEAPDAAWRALRGYMGSVALDPSGGYVACSSPRGGCVSVWRIDGRYVGSVRLIDGCGLAMAREPGQFIAASGYGEVIVFGVEDGALGIISRHTGGPRFDNHMVRVG